MTMRLKTEHIHTSTNRSTNRKLGLWLWVIIRICWFWACNLQLATRKANCKLRTKLKASGDVVVVRVDALRLRCTLRSLVCVVFCCCFHCRCCLSGVEWTRRKTQRETQHKTTTTTHNNRHGKAQLWAHCAVHLLMCIVRRLLRPLRSSVVGGCGGGELARQRMSLATAAATATTAIRPPPQRASSSSSQGHYVAPTLLLLAIRPGEFCFIVLCGASEMAKG